MSYSINQTKYLSKNELADLRFVLEKFKNEDVRNVLMIEVALATGARASEVLAIRRADLNEESQSIFIKGLKNSNDREIPVQKALFKRLMALPGDRLFQISYQRLVQVWAQYRPSLKGFHSIRHTKGLEIYAKHRDIKLVQLVLGHRNLMNSNVYCDYHYAQTELRRLLK